jgi:hypothetical protein
MLEAIALLLMQSGSVTLDLPNSTVKDAIKAIGAQTKMSFTASAECAAQTITVRVKSAPVQDLLDKIAEVTGATWTVDERGEHRLSRPPAREKAQKVESQKNLLAGTRTALAKMVEIGNQSFNPQDAIRKKLGLGQGSEADRAMRSEISYGPDQPSSRIIYRLLKYVSPEAVAGLEPGGRLVYSTQPTKMQVPFPDAAKQEIAWINRTHRELVEALKKRPNTTHHFSMADTQEWEFPVTRLSLAITPPQYGGGNLQLMAFSATGAQVFTAYAELRPDRVAEPILPLKLSAKANFSPEEAEFREFMSPSEGPEKPMPPTVRDFILDVPGRDARTAVARRILGAAAEQNNLQFVAGLPSALFFADQAYDPDQPIARYWTSIASLIEPHLADGWLTVAPADIYQDRQSAYRSDTVAEFFRQCNQQGRISLLAKARLYASVPIAYGFGPEQWLGRTLGPDGSASMLPEFPLAFQFVGTLDDASLKAMDGQPLALNVLPLRARTVLARYLYSRGGSMRRQVGRASVSVEPTDALPNGLTGGTITLNRVREACAFDASEEAMPDRMSFDARNVAFQLGQKERGAPKNVRIIDRFRMGSRTTWTFTVDLGQGLTSVLRFEETQLNHQDRPLYLEELPNELKAEVKKFMDADRKAGPPRRPPPP